MSEYRFTSPRVKSSFVFGSIAKNPTSLRFLFFENSKLRHDNGVYNEQHKILGRSGGLERSVSKRWHVRTSGVLSGQIFLYVWFGNEKPNIAPELIFRKFES